MNVFESKGIHPSFPTAECRRMSRMPMTSAGINSMPARSGSQERNALGEKPKDSDPVAEDQQSAKAPAVPVISAALTPTVSAAAAGPQSTKADEKHEEEHEMNYRDIPIWQKSMERLGAHDAKKSKEVADNPSITSKRTATQKAAYEAGRQAGRAERAKQENEERIRSSRQGYNPDQNGNEEELK